MSVASMWNVRVDVHRASGDLAADSLTPVITVQPRRPSQIKITVPIGGASAAAQATVSGTAVGGGSITEVVPLFDGENSTQRIFETVASVSLSGVSAATKVQATTTGGDQTRRWTQIFTQLKLFKSDNVIRGEWASREQAGAQELGARFFSAAPANIGLWTPQIGDVMIDAEGEASEIRRVVNATGRGGILSHYELRTGPREGALT